MRRLAITLLLALLAGWIGSSFLASSAAAGGVTSHVATVPPTTPATDPAPTGTGSDTADDLAPVDVLQVSGLFDEIVVHSIEDAIDRAADHGSQALILQLNTEGAIVSRSTMQGLLQRVADAPIAIGIWVGPDRGARAYGLPAQLFAVADVTAMVPGSRLGHTSDPLFVDGTAISFGASTDKLRNGSMNFNEARTAGVLKLDITDQGVPTVRSMVAAMDGVDTDTGQLDTLADSLNDEGGVQKNLTLVRFNGLGLIDEIMHTVASPPMAFLLLIIGLALLVFEFFTAGVGVGGLVGAVCAILGCYGLEALPASGIAVALLVLSMLAFAVDVQVGIPRLWTGVGLVLFVIGAWTLYDPIPGTDLRLGWFTLIVAVIGVLLTFVVGMPSMVRTRFATPTIGREWMIGEIGSATTSISPEGVALVSGARWRARTNRATPIAAGGELRVTAIDGVTLEVEPAEGGARDYRERRAKSSVD